MDKLPLVVMRANDTCFLGILRSCGIAGIPTVPVVFDWPGSGPWYSEASKYFLDPVRIPNPGTDDQGAVAALVELGKRLTDRYGRRLMVVSSSDTNLMLLQNNFEVLAPYYLYMGSADFASPRLDVVRKDGFAEALAKRGVASPVTLPCVYPDEVEGVVAAMLYPCLYKPTHKDYMQSFQNTHGMLKAIECQTPDELRAGLHKELAAGYELVVQEKLTFSNPEDESPCYVYSDADQNVRLACCAHKEGEFPKRYGTGTLLRLTWIEELLELSKPVVEALRWRGILGIEFMRSDRDGQWKVIEANMRPWLFHYLQSAFGLNYLEYLYHDAYDELPPYGGPQKPSGEVLAMTPLHVNLTAVVGEIAGGCTSTAEFVARLDQWLAEHPGVKTFSYLTNDDPEPGMQELEALTAHLDEPATAIRNVSRMLLRAAVKEQDILTRTLHAS